MNDIAKILNRVKDEWQTPRRAVHKGVACPFLLQCEFSPEGSSTSMLAVQFDRGLHQFWAISKSAALFKDVEYEQWGLEIMAPEEAITLTKEERISRPSDYSAHDLIIGRFKGDSDLLLLSPSKSSDVADVLVSLPLYGRNDWPIVAHSFEEFLTRYISFQGDKYWEE